MKKLIETRLAVIVFACVGLVALALLSAVLRDFSFQPTEPFSFNYFGGLPALPQSGTGLKTPIWKFILFGFLLLAIFATVMVLLDAEARKRVLLKIFRFAMTMLAIWMLMNYAYERGSLQQLLNLVPANGAGQSSPGQTSTPEYVPPQISPWLVLAVSFAIGLALILLGWFIYSRRSKPRLFNPVDEIAGIAREALTGLQPDRDWREWNEAIVRAYLRMSEVVTAERGLIRQPATTPTEFARRMARSGLPAEAVVTLTHLFEGVRYGAKNASMQDRDQAAAALSAILRACGVNQ
jgi:hypothetical protein